MKSILQKKTSIVGEFIDIQLHKDKLYLWNFDGEVNVVDFEAYIRVANCVDEPLLLNEAILLDKFPTPGTSLPIDTYIMQNNLYFATDDGVYKGYVQNRKEDKFLLSLKPKKIWDARVFTITKKSNSQLLSFASGDDGLYELNFSKLEMVGVKSVEKNIFLINNQPSHFARYSNLNIESFSRGDKLLANFRRETHKRIFEGINKEVDFDINHTTIDGLDFYEASDCLTVYQNGQRILQYDEEIVRWRYFNRGAFNGFLFVLTNEMADIYELLTSGNKDIVATTSELGTDFVGVYTPQGAEGKYGIDDNGLLHKGGKDATIAAFHAYLNVTDPTAVAFDGSTVTAINGIAADKVADTAVYDLSGRRVYGKLNKGLYIMNGKKVVVK